MIYYRFFIDDIQIPEPNNIGGWEKLLTNIKRDQSALKGLLITQDVELTFIGEQYRFFSDAYFNTGICAEFRTLIQQSYDDVNYITLHRGIIKLRDVILKDMLKGEATAVIKDDSFYARIDNNKSIATNLKGGWSKNGEPIDRCDDYDTALYTPVDGSSAGSQPTLSVHKAMEYLVRWMSDDEVSFRSDFLESDLQMVIQQGIVLRTGTDPSPYWEISFEKLFSNIKKLRDISYQIEYDINEKPIFRLERAAFFYSQTPATDEDGNEIIFSDPENIETSVNKNELYGKLKIGSTVIFDNLPTVTYPESARFNSFKEEELYILGQCNRDNTLDLVKDLVISSNVIEDIVVNASPDYDDEIILIVVDAIDDNALTANAKMSTNLGSSSPPEFYNMDLLNSIVAKDYFTTFQGGLVAGFLNFTGNEFSAITNVQTTYGDNTIPAIPLDPAAPLQIDPINYQIDVDINGNFNLATDTYTAPVSGFYVFNIFEHFDVSGYGDGVTTFNLVRIRWGIEINGVKTQLHSQNFFNGFQVVNITQSVILAAGDTVSVYKDMLSFGVYVAAVHQRVKFRTACKFSATSTPDTGGQVATYDPQDVRNVLMKFKYSIGSRLFDSIKSQLTKQYTIYSSVLNRSFKGWIDSISYPHKDGSADVVLKTSVRTINSESESSREKLPAYRFEFDMTDVSDILNDFTYNSGLDISTVNHALSDSKINIIAAISSAFAGDGITFDEIIIHRSSITGAKFHYVIIILNPNFDITVIGYDGTNKLGSFFYY